MTQSYLLGAVAYDPKVVTIWSGFASWFLQEGFPFDFVLYSNYERQVEDLVAGRLEVAWNSPLAWVRTRRMAETRGLDVDPLVMRDTDRDLVSVVAVRADTAICTAQDLRGRTVATGAADSPQATLLPLLLLEQAGLEAGLDVQIERFDVGLGLHGDDLSGERAAFRALLGGSVDAACMLDANHLLFSQEGLTPAGSTRIVLQTPPYDHCNMTRGPAAREAETLTFVELLLGMTYDDPDLRYLFDLEGLKAWLPPRLDGYSALQAAVDRFAYYGPQGELRA